MNHRSKKITSYIVSLIIVVAALIWAGQKFIHLGDIEFTDNAMIQQQVVPVNTRVQGYIKEIRFQEFQHVNKGDTLVIIDDADIRLLLAKAEADYRNALAGRGVTDRSVRVAAANISVSEASVAEAKVMMEHAATELARYDALLKKEAVTLQQYDAIKAEYDARKARYEMLVRQTSTSTSAAAETRERLAQNDAGIELAAATLESARLNLSYTVILAPCDGYTSRKEIQVGQLVQPGQTLLDVVDESEIWIIANYKETQLKHIHPGSDVEIKVDAYPGIVYHGKVEALSQATGSKLSLMPQDNSSGNFVKVRQRIPVKISFTEENSNEEMSLLKAGMNVECEVKY